MSTRLRVVKAVSRVREDGAYSNLILDDMLDGLYGSDKAFAKRLFSGTLEKSYRLEFILSQYTKLDKLPAQVVSVLLVGMYQLMYMNGVPDFSAINESVDITKRLGFIGLSGLVNGTLRNMQRKNYEFAMPDDPVEILAVQHSVPAHLVRHWVDSYGMEGAKQILVGSESEPPLFLAINTVNTSRESVIDGLLSMGLSITEVHHLVRVNGGGIPRELYGYDRGAFFVQDISAALAVEALAPVPSDRVLDMCAAPGGKSFAAAVRMGGCGTVLAMDLHEHRLRLVKSGAKRLMLKNIEIIQHDATVYDESLGTFDKVICDVPCSGYGTLRRKPEVRYKSIEECESLPELQLRILSNGIKYLKKGGRVLYSTCTLSPMENEEVSKRAEELYGIKRIEERTMFPVKGGGDGFYYCVMEKI